MFRLRRLEAKAGFGLLKGLFDLHTAAIQVNILPTQRQQLTRRIPVASAITRMG